MTKADVKFMTKQIADLKARAASASGLEKTRLEGAVKYYEQRMPKGWVSP